MHEVARPFCTDLLRPGRDRRRAARRHSSGGDLPGASGCRRNKRRSRRTPRSRDRAGRRSRPRCSGRAPASRKPSRWPPRRYRPDRPLRIGKIKARIATTVIDGDWTRGRVEGRGQPCPAARRDLHGVQRIDVLMTRRVVQDRGVRWNPDEVGGRFHRASPQDLVGARRPNRPGRTAARERARGSRR